MMTVETKKPIHILLIDDNVNDRLLITRQLTHTFPNLQITEVSQTHELSQALERTDFDLVITDYQIYWTNGLAVFEACKGRWPECPVIMFTATGNEEIAVKAMKAGLDDYILKSPKQLPRLSAAAQSALKKSRQRQALEKALQQSDDRLELVRESLERRNRELMLLNRASQAFISTLDLDEVLNSVLEEVRNSLNVIACSVWLVDPETNELVCRQVTEPQSDIVRGWRLPPGKGLGGWVVKHGQSLIVPDVYQNEQHFKGVDKQTGLPIRSILTIPLRTKKGVIGVLQIVDETVDRFDMTDQRLGEALAGVAASAIENAQLYEQAQRDAETKAILIDEINHRVKNNLAAIIGLLYAERRHTGMENEATYQTIMKNLINRVQGLATVHGLLSASGWSSLRLSDLANQIIHSALQALLPDKEVFIMVSPSALRVVPKQAHSLAMVINELTTNTIKYALQGRDVVHIMVNIRLDDTTDSTAQMVIFEFRDDGPGYPEAVLRSELHNVGLYMVQSIVRTDLQGALTFDNDNGAVTIICFKLLE